MLRNSKKKRKDTQQFCNEEQKFTRTPHFFPTLSARDNIIREEKHYTSTSYSVLLKLFNFVVSIPSVVSEASNFTKNFFFSMGNNSHYLLGTNDNWDDTNDEYSGFIKKCGGILEPIQTSFLNEIKHSSCLASSFTLYAADNQTSTEMTDQLNCIERNYDEECKKNINGVIVTLSILVPLACCASFLVYKAINKRNQNNLPDAKQENEEAKLLRQVSIKEAIGEAGINPVDPISDLISQYDGCRRSSDPLEIKVINDKEDDEEQDDEQEQGYRRLLSPAR